MSLLNHSLPDLPLPPYEGSSWYFQIQQGVAITGRNRTGPPCSVGRPTAHAPGGRPACPSGMCE